MQIQDDGRVRESLAIAAEAGFRYVSLGFGSSGSFLADDWEEKTGRICDRLNELGMRCVMTHAPYYDLRISAEFLDDGMERGLLRCLRATGTLGGEIMAVHPRGYYRADGPAPENGFYRNGFEDRAESFRLNVKNLAPLAEEAIRCGVRVGIENLPVFPGWAMTFCSDDPDVHRRLIDAFDPAAVTGVWDFGHAYLANKDPAEVLASFPGRIAGPHVHDNDRTGDQHLIPFLGTIDWQPQMDALRSTGFDGYLTMELEYPDPNADRPASLRFMKTAFENISRLDEMLRG